MIARAQQASNFPDMHRTRQHKEVLKMCDHTTEEFLRAAGMDDEADEMIEKLEGEEIEGVAVI